MEWRGLSTNGVKKEELKGGVINWISVLRKSQQSKHFQMKILCLLAVITLVERGHFVQDGYLNFGGSDGNSSFVKKRYVYTEISPLSSMMCPKGYFISQIHYHFKKPEGYEKNHPNEMKFMDTVVFDQKTLDIFDAVIGHFLLKDQRIRRFGLTKHRYGYSDRELLKIAKIPDAELRDLFEIATQNISDPLGNRLEHIVKGMEPLRVGLCPTLALCIGHQACLFHFSNDFCGVDPVPKFRKHLQIEMTCMADAQIHKTLHQSLPMILHSKMPLFKEVFSVWSENVQYIICKEIPEEIKLDDKNREVHDKNRPAKAKKLEFKHSIPVTVKSYNLQEDDVFGLSCEGVHELNNHGYYGECINSPQPKPVVSDNLWKVVGRIPTKECRNEVRQIYCAYVYNPSGNCVPPFMLQTQNTKNTRPPTYDFKSLPTPGRRPETWKFKKIHLHPYVHMIPARIGFMILAHQSPEAVFQLLKMIYRPIHYYVIHVDQRKQDVRQGLMEKIEKAFPNDNVRVLPEHRSFKASWGSYYILRAELECFEELLRMGLWDFVINLSGADLPIRNVDDLTAMLAPHRGRSFLRINSVIEYEKDPPMRYAWHSCNGHVYNVTFRGNRKEKLYSSSQWGIFSRDFVEFLISPIRDDLLNQFQLYLQTTFISDETYIISMLMASFFSTTMGEFCISHMKNFENRDRNNLCRHMDETDACGRGPGTFTTDDFHNIKDNANHFFFARKFDYTATNKARQMVIEMNEDNWYQKEILKIIPNKIWEYWAYKSIKRLYPGEGNIQVKNITNTKVFPKMTTSDPCCYYTMKYGIFSFEEYLYWLDFDMIFQNGTIKSARATISPRISHHCYPKGHIRGMHVTTVAESSFKESDDEQNDFSKADPTHRRKQNSRSSKKTTVHKEIEKMVQNGFRRIPEVAMMGQDTKSLPQVSRTGRPVPYIPFNEKGIYVQLFIHVGDIEKHCQGTSPSMLKYRNYATFPLKEHRTTGEAILFDASITDPFGNIVHTEDVMVDLGPHAIQRRSDHTVFTKFLKVNVTKQGEWKIDLRQRGPPVDRPFQYSSTVFVLDDKAKLDEKKDIFDNLWKIENVILEEWILNDFYANKHQRKNTIRRKTTVQPNLVDVPESLQLKRSLMDNAAVDIKLKDEKRKIVHASDIQSDAVDVIYYTFFGAVYIFIFVIYQMCQGKGKCAFRKIIFKKRHLFFFTLVIAMQYFFYKMGRSKT